MGVYVFDTNIIVHLAWQSYPVDRFPRMHAWIDTLVAADRVIAPTFVKKECENYQNEAFNWIKTREAKVIQPHDGPLQANAQGVDLTLTSPAEEMHPREFSRDYAGL